MIENRIEKHQEESTKGFFRIFLLGLIFSFILYIVLFYTSLIILGNHNNWVYEQIVLIIPVCFMMIYMILTLDAEKNKEK